MAKTTKRQRDVMKQHLAAPHMTTQATVIRKLKLSDTNAFYRLAYRVIKADALEKIELAE